MKIKTYFFTALMLSVSMMTSAQKKLVALSFDDGPNTGTTVRMLDVLKKHDVKASFFVIGKNINEESAKVMMRAHNEGHDIENHSLTHASMPSLSADSVKREVEITTALIEKYTGEKPQFFRPPYIAVSKPMFDAVGLPFICGEGCNPGECRHTHGTHPGFGSRRTNLSASRHAWQRTDGGGSRSYHSCSERKGI